MCLAPQRRAIFRHLTFKKWSGPVSFLRFWLANVLLAHSGVPFFRIATCKMAPALRGFVHFDAQMCLAPQSRANFADHNFQNGSANVVFCAFWLANALRATAACHFSPVCPNSYLRTRRFSEPTFRTSGTTNHWKNAAIRDVPNIFRACTFFLVTLHACWSSFCWLDISTLLDTSTLLFNSAYSRKLDF